MVVNLNDKSQSTQEIKKKKNTRKRKSTSIKNFQDLDVDWIICLTG